MKVHRFSFADEYDGQPSTPARVWLTRSILTGLIAGLGSSGYLLGYLRF